MTATRRKCFYRGAFLLLSAVTAYPASTHSPRTPAHCCYCRALAHGTLPLLHVTEREVTYSNGDTYKASTSLVATHNSITHAPPHTAQTHKHANTQSKNRVRCWATSATARAHTPRPQVTSTAGPGAATCDTDRAPSEQRAAWFMRAAGWMTRRAGEE